MAVSDSQIAQMQREQAELDRELRRVKSELNAARDEVIAQNRHQLDALTAQVDARIQQRDQQVQSQFESMLEQSVSDREKLLEQEFQRYQQQYDALDIQLRAAMAEEQRKTEETLLAQKKFEEAYFARRALAEKRAKDVCDKTVTTVRGILKRVPLEWFKAGHIDRYRSSLQNMEQWMEEGFYESVIAIGENIMLSIQLDEIEVEKKCRQWFHYYQMLYGTLAAEQRLLFEAAVKVAEDMEMFCHYEKIVDGRLQPQHLQYWSDGKYQKLLDEYARIRSVMEQFKVDGTALQEMEEVRQFMIVHPELSAEYQEMSLYSSAMKAAQRMERTEQQIRRMHDRMRCYDERLRLAREIKEAMNAADYSTNLHRVYNKPGDPMVIGFSDSMNVFGIEVYLIPVQRRADGRWINTASCVIPADCSMERKEEIQHILAGVLVTQGIGIAYEDMRRDQEVTERVRILTTDSRLRINGRIN